MAPRELGALFASRISDKFRIDVATRQVLIACGAGAGLAAVYHVPFAGAIFTLEILLGIFSPYYAMLALAISGIATLVARIAVSSETFISSGNWTALGKLAFGHAL